MTTTAALVDHLHAIRIEDLPGEVQRYATVLITDALGAGLYGSRTEVGDIVLRSVRSAAGRTPIWGRKETLDPASSALVNGTQAHACELDDYHPGAKCHPGAVVVPAALAAASLRRTTGADLIRAVVAGYEAMVRTSLAAGANATRRRGWHLTGIVGPFGAATAAAVIEEAEPTVLRRALGIAGSHAGGLFAFSASGAMTKRLHAGRAAESGLRSVQLAQEGFTGPPDVLEAADGGFLSAVSDDADPARLVAGFAQPYVLMQTAIKPYSCCGSLHSSIDAVIQLVEEHDLSGDDIAEITAHNASVVEQQCAFPYSGDGGLLEAQMSVNYCLAVAALDRAAFLPQFAEDRIDRRDVQELARRVGFEIDPVIDREYPRAMPARVTIRTRSGDVLERGVPGPTGSTFAPFGPEEEADKFRSLAEGVLDTTRVEELLAALTDLPSLDDVNELGPLLAA